MRGQAGTAENSISLPVASYEYGTAGNGSLTAPLLEFAQGPDITLPADIGSVQILASTFHDFLSGTPDGGQGYVSWHMLVDITGDGRTDLVFKKNNQLWLAVNRPDGTLSTSLVGAPTKMLSNDGRPLSKHSAESLRYGYSWQTRLHDWRQVIDINSDGRLDIVDAEQHDGQWTVYLNTPGAPVTWVERRINTFHIKTVLESLGHHIDGNKVPLSRRTVGFDTEMSECYTWNASSQRYIRHPFETACPWNEMFPYVQQHRVSSERTFLEWGLKDLNGDGYPDLIVGASPVEREDFDFSDAPFGGPFKLNTVVRALAPETEGTRVLFNVAGVRLNSENVFSAQVTVDGCAPERWDGTTQTCGFSDIDADGVQDRITPLWAYLGAGAVTGGPKVRVRADTSWRKTENLHDTQCDVSPESVERIRETLRDVNGDGILDRVEDRKVYFGTGTDYAPAVDVSSPFFELSSSVDDCGGEYSRTTAGLYDMNGDGKPEVVRIAHNPPRLEVFYLVGGATGRDAAGKLTSISNGYGATTRFTYRSAKEHDSALPSPEIVISSIETVSAVASGSTLLSTVSFAYGSARLLFDPGADSFTTRGYETVVEVYGHGQEADQAIYGVVRLASPIQPYIGNTTQSSRFGRYQLAGRASYSFFVGGHVPRDAWTLLTSFDPWTDLRRLGMTHHTWATKHTTLPQPAGNAVDCEDIPDPYVWSEPGTGLSLCDSAGFSFVESTESWAGTQPPPGTFNNIETRQDVISVDEYSNVLSLRNWNDTSVQDDDVCTEMVYASPVAGTSIRSALILKRLTDCGPSDHRQILSLEHWEYDGLASGSVSKGHITSHSVERFANDTGASMGLIREYEAIHDSVGNIEYIATSRGDAVRSIEIFYDQYGLAPIRTKVDGSNVASREVTIERNSTTLILEASTDTNGLRSGQRVDGFGRQTSTTVKPHGGAVGVTSATFYGGFEAGGHRSITVKTFADPVDAGSESTSTGRQITTWLDELGRPHEVFKQLGADYTEQGLTVSRRYDGLGRVSFETDPYPASQTPASAYGTSYHYGPDGSLYCAVRGHGPQSIALTSNLSQELFPTCQVKAYSNHTMQMLVTGADSAAAGTPQTGTTRKDTLGATGRVLSRETLNAGIRLELETFAYDRLGQMTGITRYRDPVGATEPVQWKFAYDSLGQQISVSEPESAVRTHTYSVWGERTATTWTDTTVTPSVSMKVEQEFDSLGRIVSSQEHGLGGPLPETKFEWFYDVNEGAPLAGSSNLVGRLTRTHSVIGDLFLSYDQYGGVRDRAFVNPAEEVFLEHFINTFDGTLKTLEFRLPDNGYAAERYHYTYDSAAVLISVNSEDGESLFSTNEVDPFGRIRSANYGERVLYTAVHADTGRRLPQRWQVSLLSGESRSVHYDDYDSMARLLNKHEEANGSLTDSVDSSYDSLGRLAASTSTAAQNGYASVFQYDALGNVKSLVDAAAATQVSMRAATGTGSDLDRICRIDYGPPSVGPCNVKYDGSGNIVEQITPDAGRHLTYFPSGSIRTVLQGSVSASFRYDGSGAISELDIDGGKDPRKTRRYGLVERRQVLGGNGSVIVRQIPGAGGLVATRRGPDGAYTVPFAEARGTRFSTDGQEFIQEVNYSPFGVKVSSGQPGSVNYTNQQWNGGDALEDLGLVNLGARLYDPAIGRFLSRDPLVLPTSATKGNPYGFAFNDPINGSDPSGLESDQSICGTSSGVVCDDIDPDPLGTAIAISGMMGAVMAGYAGGARVGMDSDYLPADRISAAMIGNVATFYVPIVVGPDFISELESAPRGIAYPVDPDRLPPFLDWIYGDPTGDIGTMPPFRIVALAIWEMMGAGIIRAPVRGFIYPVARSGVQAARLSSGAIGTLGEQAAADYLRGRGYSNVRAIQNASNQGLDLVGEIALETHFFEVKASAGAVAGALRGDQRNIVNFVNTRLQRAFARVGQWKNVPQGVSDDARSLRAQIRSGMPIQGEVIEVTNTGSPTQTITSRPW